MSSVNFDPIKNNFIASQCVLMERGAQRQPATTLWGKALEALRERRERELGETYSQYQLAKDADIPQSEYRNMLRRGVRGPSLSKVDSLLRAMHYTWNEWGIEYESVKRRELILAHHPKAIPVEKVLKGGTKKSSAG